MKNTSRKEPLPAIGLALLVTATLGPTVGGCRRAQFNGNGGKAPDVASAPSNATNPNAEGGQRASTGDAARAAGPMVFTADNNPTTLAGRGEPSLEDHQRPAAWIYIDGRAGEYREENGRKLLQWYTPGTVSPTPTFRLEAYAPLIADPESVLLALEPVIRDGSRVGTAYDIAPKPGTFQLGKTYSLCRPGPGFTVRARRSPTTIDAIPPLVPGTYMLAASIRKQPGDASGALAVTFFTVGDDAVGHDTPDNDTP